MIYFILIIIAIFIFNHVKSLFTDPPGPRGLPFVGIFPFILLKIIFQSITNDNKFFQLMRRKYGQIWCFRSNNQRYIVLTSMEIQTEAFKDLGSSFAGRPLSTMHRYFSDRIGVLTSDGEVWKLYRKLTTKALHEIALQTNGFEEIIRENVDKVTDFLDGKSDQNINTSSLFHSLSLAIIFKIIFNNNLKVDDPKIKAYAENVNIITSTNLILSDSVFCLTDVPLIKYLFPRTRKMRESVDRNKEILKELWKDFEKRNQENQMEEKCIGGYFRKHLAAKDENKNTDKYLNEFNFIQNFSDIASAGSDTVAATLTWCCLMLAAHTDIQEILHQELEEFHDNRSISTISYSDRSYLPNLCSFIEEIHRFITIIPRTVHRPMETISFHGFTLTENDIVLGDNDAINHDSNTWLDPDVFKYDRFISKSTEEIRPCQKSITFGMGKRNCIGENLARIEVFITLAIMLHKYQITLPKEVTGGLEEIMKGKIGLVHTPLHHILKFHKL